MHDYIKKYHDQVEWTETWDQNEVAGKASLLIDKILLRIYESKLEIHKTLNLFELSLLFRWPVHVGVNIFIERLLRVAAIHRNGGTYDFPLTDSKDNYHETTTQSVQALYYDFSINYNLLNDLAKIFGVTKNKSARWLGFHHNHKSQISEK